MKEPINMYEIEWKGKPALATDSYMEQISPTTFSTYMIYAFIEDADYGSAENKLIENIRSEMHGKKFSAMKEPPKSIQRIHKLDTEVTF